MSKKGQVVIPKELREKLGIHPGDVFIFKIQNNEIILEKVEKSMADLLKNCKPLSENSTTFQNKLRDEWN